MTQTTRIQVKTEAPGLMLRLWEALGAYGRIGFVKG